MIAQASLDQDYVRDGESLSMDGSLNVTGPIVLSSQFGTDYGKAAVAAVQALIDQDDRVAKGHFFSITITG